MNIVRFALGLLGLCVACRSKATASALPTDPLAWAPSYARGVLVVDVRRLRRAPALDRWLRHRAGNDCAARLSERVHRIAAVSLDGGAETLGLVLAGDLSSSEVVACARQRASQAQVRSVSHRGVALTRVTSAGDAAEAEVNFLSNGVALIGPPWVARALLDAGLSHAQGHGETPALGPHWDALPPNADVRAAWFPTSAARGALGLDALRLAATGREALELTLTAVLPTDEAAVALAQRGVTWRNETAPTLQHAPLRALVQGVRLRAEGRAVSASLSLDGPRLDALWSSLSVLASSP